MMGAAVVPLAYMSVWLLTKSLMSSLFAALLILLGMGLYSTWQSFWTLQLKCYQTILPQFKFLNFAFFRCRNINPFSTYFAGPHYDVLHYDVYLFSAEVSLVPWQVSFKLSSLSIMHSVPILYNSTHYLHVCVAMIVSWNFSPTF